jgi:iron complex outermembrane receptor protein
LDEVLTTLSFSHIDAYNDLADANDNKFKIDSWTTLDASVSYTGFDNLILTAGAANLMNEEAPQAPSESMGIDNKTHNALGRQMYAKFKYNF